MHGLNFCRTWSGKMQTSTKTINMDRSRSERFNWVVLLTGIGRGRRVDGERAHGLTGGRWSLPLGQHTVLGTAAGGYPAVFWLVRWDAIGYSATSHTSLDGNAILWQKLVQVHILERKRKTLILVCTVKQWAKYCTLNTTAITRFTILYKCD